MQNCQAIKLNGEVCAKRCRPGGRWCGIHNRMAVQHGEAAVLPPQAEIDRRRQAVQRQINNRRRMNHGIVWRILSRALQERTGIPLNRNHRPALRAIHVAANVQEPFRAYFLQVFPRINALIEQVYQDVGGVFETAEALAAEIRRDAPLGIVPLPANLQQLLVEEALAALDVLPVPVPNLRAPARPRGELEVFAADRQNVHTEAAVRQTKDVVDRVLRIAVPEEYRYPRIKTLGEIMLDCPTLTGKAAWQLTSKYCGGEDIYDYGAGIYGRVTDAVWQFIRNSPDKVDLCKILASELQDSIGMCAQGNLSRMCNVLAGYLEGVNMESPGEQLQRRMAELSKLTDDADRLNQGRALLRELAVPDAEWQPWLEALA